MKNYNKMMEYIWLGIAIATAIFAGYQLNLGEREDITLLIVMPFVAGALYALRRFHRKKMEKLKNTEDQQKD